ncbi:MAG: glycine--tRNA ligase subunit alpha [Brevinemataceae bacterium]
MTQKKALTFQEIIFKLKEYWAAQECVIREGYDLEKGAGTFNPDTFLRTLGDKPWRTAYVEPCRRPGDGRYGKNPNRMGFYYQFQCILKPSPDNILDLYIKSLEYIGVDVNKHDLRFVHDDWKSPTLGAWGLGWEVWLDGMEITQFTYFQQIGGITLTSIPAEITYGTERLAMYLQGVEHFKDIQWNNEFKYGDLHLDSEWDYSVYSFEVADQSLYFKLFDDFEKEFVRAIEADAIFAAYDLAIKCSHIFNTLGSLGAISVTERESYILRIRKMTAEVATHWVKRIEHPCCNNR